MPAQTRYNRVKKDHVRGFGVPKGFQRHYYNDVKPVESDPEVLAPVPATEEHLLNDISENPKTVARSHVLEKKDNLLRAHHHDASKSESTSDNSNDDDLKKNGFFRQLTLILVVMIWTLTFVFVKFAKIERALHAPQKGIDEPHGNYKIKKMKLNNDYDTCSHFSNEYDEIRHNKFDDEKSVKLDYY